MSCDRGLRQTMRILREAGLTVYQARRVWAAFPAPLSHMEMAGDIVRVVRMMRDPRVHAALKALPLLALFYVVLPADLPGPADDLVVVWAANRLFLTLAEATSCEGEA